jgi:hypothetical protein
MPENQRKILESDVLATADYAAKRNDLRSASIARKKNRRIEVGPFATFYFESYESMWLQVQEMLRIEKGGAEQIPGELEAYNPLIPQGRELIATMMLEIEDAHRRDRVLRTLAGIEEKVFLEFGGERIRATPTSYEDRTTPDGKTSSIHWVRFTFSDEQTAKFRGGGGSAVLGIDHGNYGHMAMIAPAVRDELARDFA